MINVNKLVAENQKKSYPDRIAQLFFKMM